MEQNQVSVRKEAVSVVLEKVVFDVLFVTFGRDLLLKV